MEFYIISNDEFKAILFSAKEVEKIRASYSQTDIRKIEDIETLKSEANNLKNGKFYAVKKGIVSGIFFNWKVCSKMVSKVPDALYKSFPTIEEALTFMGLLNPDNKTENTTNSEQDNLSSKGPYAYVDGSFNETTGVYGYGVILVDGEERYDFSGSGNDKDFAAMRNVAGEVLGARRAINEAIAVGLKEITIYYDYQGIECWATGVWRRNKQGTIEYHDFVQKARELIDIKFVKVKAHSGVTLNEKVDKLAKTAVGL